MRSYQAPTKGRMWDAPAQFVREKETMKKFLRENIKQRKNKCQ